MSDAAIDFESALITCILDTKDIRTVIKQKIDSSFFFDPVCKASFIFLLQWYNNPNYGDVPSWESFASSFHGFQPNRMEESVIALCDKVRESKLYADMAGIITEVSELTAGDPVAGFEALKKKVVWLASMHTVDNTTTVNASIADLREEYMAMKAGGSKALKGYPYPWDALNEATLGLQNQHLVFVYGRPKTKKCIALTTPVLSWDGTFTTIQNLCSSVTLDHGTLQWTSGEVVGHTDPQPMECFSLETQTGYLVEGLGATHPVLRPDMSYTPTSQLKIGDWIGVAGELPDFPAAADAYTWQEAELLGLLVGDGNYTRNEVQFTSQDDQIVGRVAELTELMNCHLTQGSRPIEYRIVADEGRRGSNSVLNFLRAEGIHGCKGREKHLPERVYRSGREAVLAVLGGLLATDGHVSKKGLTWNTSSITLARQVKHLLLRIGVVGCLRETFTDTGPAYAIAVEAQEQLEKLVAILPYVALEYKASALLNLVNKPIRRKRNNDGIPWSQELEDAIHAARPKATNGWKKGGWGSMPWKFNSAKLFRRSGVISRTLLRQLSIAMSAPRLLVWANSPVRWERITSLRSTGIQMTADAGVCDHHNFLVGDVVTHNTWLILEMARQLHKIGLRPLIFSQELSDIEIKRRFVALSTGVNYHRYLRGQLSPQVEADFLDDLEAFEETEPVQVSRLSTMGDACLTELNAKIDEYKANVVFIDGANYLSTDWKELAEVTRGFKRTCQAKGIPIVGSTHANRSRKGKGADVQDGADDFAYGDAFYQTCDVALRATCDIEDYKAKQVRLFTSAIREGQAVLFTVNAHLAEDLSQKAVERTGDPTDIDAEQEQDAHDAQLDQESDIPEE